MPDQRSAIEKRLDAAIGPPLYYCSECLRGCKVTPKEGTEPEVVRPCGQDCGHQIFAPRRSILAGEGGLQFADKVRVKWHQIAASLTGRCV